ncbi:MAG: hypothetical protein HOP08_18420 [Cyclobacteriaceae bacterium]|nr:hypothetical protein [Cyclobacteriaceae bacterium]NOT76903.1 hypothetical protein [Cyclobacteriaceae bacterium]
MKYFSKTLIIIPSILIGVLIGWFVFDSRECAEIDKEAIRGILERHERINTTLKQVDGITERLHVKINEKLANYPITSRPDTVKDILQHSLAVISQYSSLSSFLSKVHKSDSIVLERALVGH